MKSAKNVVLLLLALTTVGGAILAWQQYKELVELRAAAMNKDERASLQKRIWALERANKELNGRLASPRDGGDDMGDPFAGGPGGPGGGRGGFRGRGGNNPMQMANAIRNVLAKPEVQALMSVGQKARIDAQYTALFKSLNLSPDQADKVKSLLADRQTTMQDVMNAARDQGINPRTDPQGFQQLVASAQNDVNNGLKAVIGDAGFNQLQNYDQTMPQRNVVNQLQQRLSVTDTPLTSAQADQLVQVLASNPAPQRTNADGTPVPAGGGGAAMVAGGGGGAQIFVGGPGGGGGGMQTAFGGGGGGGPAADIGGAILGAFIGAGGGGAGGGPTATVTPAAVAQAQSVLAPSQVAALQQIQEQQQSQQQLQQIIRDTITAQIPNGAAAGPTGGGGGVPSKNGGG